MCYNKRKAKNYRSKTENEREEIKCVLLQLIKQIASTWEEHWIMNFHTAKG